MGTERRKLQNFQDQSEKMRLENRNFQNLMLCNRNRSVSSNYIATTPNPPSDLTGAHHVEKSQPAGSCPIVAVRNLVLKSVFILVRAACCISDASCKIQNDSNQKMDQMASKKRRNIDKKMKSCCFKLSLDHVPREFQTDLQVF